jgi:hypothetical protein
MSNWPPGVDAIDYSMFNAVAFFGALSITREPMTIGMLRRPVPVDGVPSP